MNDITYDFAGIGLGPFNLSLACLAAPVTGLNAVFLDKSKGFDWHPGMMLQDVTLQTPFLSDLVTLADPTSPFTFLNYIKEQGRIYSFYIRQNFFLLRKEYNQYCQWAAERLPSLRFNTEVQNIEYDPAGQCYLIQARDTLRETPVTYRVKKLVLGTGPVPYKPECCRGLSGLSLHSSDYLKFKESLQKKRSITVLGSGQSAAEIFYDLLTEVDIHNYELSWITRSPRFFPLEYTKLTLEMTSPEYVDYFYGLPEEKRKQLNARQKNLFKGINSELINAIFDLIYTKRLSGEFRINLLTNSELKIAERNAGEDSFDLHFWQHEQDEYFHHSTEGLVLATGYAYRTPSYLNGIHSRIRWDQQGRFDVHRNYAIDHADNEIFVQNAEYHTHGFVTPDLGMACYRNSIILRELTGREHYPVEKKIAFQEFSAHPAGILSPEPELTRP
ncbi:MAG: lysine N(6)-hydroxylase/L-ornithine N(5)-oxygenase family protein [Nitrospina sp.]|nr:lysine N(6)-hydroxylase/L-ornithine N(5)-oxygenase family protein [Nitrospina sp.]